MTPIIIFLLLNALSATAFLLGRRFLQSPRKALLAALLCALLLAAKALFALHPALEWQAFPFPAYAYLQRFYLIPALLLALAALIPQLPKLHLLNFLALATFLWGLAISSFLLRPAQASNHFPDSQHHFTQSSPQTCAPAACACALSYLGIITTEQTMAQRCLTSAQGTTDLCIPLALNTSLQSTPWHARLTELPANKLTQPGTLAIISIDHHTHAVCLFATPNGIIINDPLAANPQLWTLTQLQQNYSGIATVIEPSVP